MTTEPETPATRQPSIVKKGTSMKRLAAIALAGASTILAFAVAEASPSDDLAAAKAASARFHSLEQARASGYEEASPCEQHPELGGMGHHYVNQALVMDPAVDPTHPEVLLYAPRANGKLELVGLEYFKVDADQNFATDSDRPSLFGQPFDGPMAGHAPGMPIHYDLHVWLWQDNPEGFFEAWNPTVVCPGSED